MAICRLARVTADEYVVRRALAIADVILAVHTFLLLEAFLISGPLQRLHNQSEVTLRQSVALRQWNF